MIANNSINIKTYLSKAIPYTTKVSLKKSFAFFVVFETSAELFSMKVLFMDSGIWRYLI